MFQWGIQIFLTVKYSVIAVSSNLDEHDKWQQVGFIKVNGLMIYKWRYIRVKIIALIVPLNNVNFEYTLLECSGEVSLLLYYSWHGIYFRCANNLEKISTASYSCPIT